MLNSLSEYCGVFKTEPNNARDVLKERLKVIWNGLAVRDFIKPFGSMSTRKICIFDSSPAPLSKIGQ